MNAADRRCAPPDHEVGVRAIDLGLLRMIGADPLVDSRGMLGIAEGRAVMTAALASHVAELDDGITIGGVANSGSLVGMLLADRLALPFINVLVDGPRSKGLRRRLEPDDGVAAAQVVLVDNWVSTGRSLLDAAVLVEAHGGTVVGALSVSASTDLDVRMLPFPLHVAFPLPDLLQLRTERNSNR